MGLYEQIQEARSFIQSLSSFAPKTGIILGTGLGKLTAEIEVSAEIPYATIPHFARSTVESHQGKLVLGMLNGQPVVVMAGRFHYYEGWNMKQVTFPVRVMHSLGIQNLIVTNVSGGVNPQYKAGDIVVVHDHINLLPASAPRRERRTPGAAISRHAKHLFPRNARCGIRGGKRTSNSRSGWCLFCTTRPQPGDSQPNTACCGALGADCTGMSSVPEVLVAKHMNLPVMMLSMVSNVCWPRNAIRETSLEDVVAVANEAEPKLRTLIKGVLQKMG
ncbi:MAG: purine-nucleoside phosphorylase [Saprospiraceae bacterium]